VVVFDASTLILLARAELLDVFLGDYQEAVLIPAAVQVECVAIVSAPGAVLIRERIRSGRIRVKRIRSDLAVTKLMADFRLGRGEAEVLVLARAQKADLVASDDRQAIRACKLLGIPFTTALAFLIRAAEKRLLTTEEAQASLRRLVRFGRHEAAIVRDAEERLREMDHEETSEDA
jgi:predicted nucleic acid-binding protein